jgi:hypothetical protein
MRSKAYILHNFCIIDSMKLYNQGFPFLYNTFYQVGVGWAKFCQGGQAPPAPALATPLATISEQLANEINDGGEVSGSTDSPEGNDGCCASVLNASMNSKESSANIDENAILKEYR